MSGATSTDAVRLTLESPLAVIAIDRPAAKNSLRLDEMTAIADAIGEAVSAGARAVLVRGTRHAFCAGRDLKDTNPLKYPIKRTYLIILIMITLVVMFVAVWIGLYMARELTVPVERLVYGAKAVGAGNLDLIITASGHDEIAVLVDSFNKMTRDLRENRERLTQAGADQSASGQPAPQASAASEPYQIAAAASAALDGAMSSEGPPAAAKPTNRRPLVRISGRK